MPMATPIAIAVLVFIRMGYPHRTVQHARTAQTRFYRRLYRLYQIFALQTPHHLPIISVTQRLLPSLAS